MPIGILFWVLMVISLFFSVWSNYTPGQPFPVRNWGGGLLVFILLAILGWKVFGSIVQ
jgi:uncharacterized membrane protein